MAWKIVERKIGKAGNSKQQQQRQRDWTRKYGDNWMIGYVIEGEFIAQEEAIQLIYYQSYALHFRTHPQDLEELLQTAKSLRNPHAEATGGVDLQVPAIMDYLHQHQLTLKGTVVLDIGTFGDSSHKLSVRLSPLTIQVVGNPKMTLEQFWQEKKCLAIWEEE